MPRPFASDISQHGLSQTFQRKSRMRRISLAAAACGAWLALSMACACYGQVASPLNLASPILPDDTFAPPTSSATGVPVGSSVSGGIVQASFTGCTSCGSVGCTGCDDFGPGYQCPPAGVGLWIRADYLIWYEKNMDTIPLATTSPNIPVDPGNFLDLDADETTVLFGGRSLNSNPLEGWRLEIGTWLDPGATFGIFGRYYDVGDRIHSFRSSSANINNLGIPYFDFDGDQEAAIELAVRNDGVTERQGILAIDIDGGFRSWEILFRRLAETGSNYRMDWVYGYRNTRLYDSLTLSASTENVVPDGLSVPNTNSSFSDSFDVKNQFHGIDLGVTGHSHDGCWSLDFMLKVALGVMDQEVTIDGRTTNLRTTAGPPVTVDRTVLIGGLFSQESNVGKNDNSEFGIIPEFDINLGYAVTPNLDFTIGYTFMYLNSVVRAGTAIDRVVDEGFLSDIDPVNSNRPQVNFDDTSYYIHGLNLGMTARF